ncbi:MAG: phosphatase PAP2 family protein [Spirochaetes bacterium]|nr:phosphatase PAP2 family protein [Spirochaetota bacterium]
MKKPHLTWYQALGRLKTLASIAVLIGASLFATAMSELIQRLYPDRPVVPDLLFTLLPDIPVLAFVTDPIMIAAIVLLFWYMFSHDRSHLPFYFFSVGITYVGRGLLSILTPLGRPTGNLDSYGVAKLVNLKQHGMFPSGHVMLAAVIYFLIDGKRHPGFKRAAGLLCLAEMITLILSRGHYSIDLVGGLMLAFIVIGWLMRYRERFRLAG